MTISQSDCLIWTTETVSHKKDILITMGWTGADPGLEKEEGPFLWSCGEVRPEIKGKKVREPFEFGSGHVIPKGSTSNRSLFLTKHFF